MENDKKQFKKQGYDYEQTPQCPAYQNSWFNQKNIPSTPPKTNMSPKKELFWVANISSNHWFSGDSR